MKVLNETKNKVLVENAKLCKSLWSIIKGLMFKKINENEGLVMKFNGEKNLGFHGWFVPQTLQLIGIKDNKVVEIHILKPWRMKVMKEHIDYLIEILPGKKVEIGDKIKF